MTGQGVNLAIVDTGMNVAHLRAKGQPAKLGTNKHFTPAGRDHAARQARRRPRHDVRVRRRHRGARRPRTSTTRCCSRRPRGRRPWPGLLSDAVQSYAKLRRVLDAMPAEPPRAGGLELLGHVRPLVGLPGRAPGQLQRQPAPPVQRDRGQPRGRRRRHPVRRRQLRARLPGRPLPLPPPPRLRGQLARARAERRRDRHQAQARRLLVAGPRPAGGAEARPRRSTRTSRARRCSRRTPTAAPRPRARSWPGWWPRCARSTPPRGCPRRRCARCWSRRPTTSAASASTTTTAGARTNTTALLAALKNVPTTRARR